MPKIVWTRLLLLLVIWLIAVLGLASCATKPPTATPKIEYTSDFLNKVADFGEEYHRQRALGVADPVIAVPEEVDQALSIWATTVQ